MKKKTVPNRRPFRSLRVSLMTRSFCPVMMMIMIIIFIIFIINCNWVVPGAVVISHVHKTRNRLLLNLSREGYMRSM